jgi:excisionase family DNA binding protein
MNDSREYLTINQAADYLGLSRHKIRRLIKSDKLHAIEDWKDGHQRLIHVSELDRLRERYDERLPVPATTSPAQVFRG